MSGISCRDATIKRQSERIITLEAALKPFAAWASEFGVEVSDKRALVGNYEDPERHIILVTLGDLRTARKALEGTQE